DRLERSNFFDGPRRVTPEREREVHALGATVEQSEAFAERELTGVPGVWEYRLRGSRRSLFLRHGTQDVAILDEVFRKRVYDPPAHVEEALAPRDRPLSVVDVGANIGLFALFIAERLRAGMIVGFEPDPSNITILERAMTASHEKASWQLVPACAGTRAGSVRFRTGLFACSRIAEADADDEETTVTPVVDAFPYLQDADLVKIDVEGGEWALLADPRLGGTAIRAIALEYHWHLSPPGRPGAAAERLLRRAGFAVEVLHERPDGQGMLWAWRHA
ncbi:MAG: FkbM family methyltransferase, partial [Actinomycetota bacterium]|nr:FkbM family methyltransferase [Actinomycetota bacterium]